VSPQDESLITSMILTQILPKLIRDDWGKVNIQPI
jgi:hypothetical protein